MQNTSYNIVVFLLLTTFLIVLMGVFIITLIFLHRKKQLANQNNLKQIEANYEKNLFHTQLEIQEQTFQNISREIHDNISLSLTLSKLHLHTLDWKDEDMARDKVNTAISLITQSIAELRDISKSLNADIIIQHGLLKAIDEEIGRIRQVGLFNLDYEINGTPVYMENQKELIIFRVIQEAFNNIIKHAKARNARLSLNYNEEKMSIVVADDGSGFDPDEAGTNMQAGLKNIETRIRILKGEMTIYSTIGKGTNLLFKIPYDELAKN